MSASNFSPKGWWLWVWNFSGRWLSKLLWIIVGRLSPNGSVQILKKEKGFWGQCSWVFRETPWRDLKEEGCGVFESWWVRVFRRAYNSRAREVDPHSWSHSPFYQPHIISVDFCHGRLRFFCPWSRKHPIRTYGCCYQSSWRYPSCSQRPKKHLLCVRCRGLP